MAERKAVTGTWMAIGTAIGVGIGVLLVEDLPVGIVAGIAIGLVFAIAVDQMTARRRGRGAGSRGSGPRRE